MTLEVPHIEVVPGSTVLLGDIVIAKLQGTPNEWHQGVVVVFDINERGEKSVTIEFYYLGTVSLYECEASSMVLAPGYIITPEMHKFSKKKRDELLPKPLHRP